MRFIFITVGTIMLCVGCAKRAKIESSAIMVSIEPLKYLTEQITGHDFEVNVLVPKGASPETYEPLPSQMRKVTESSLYVAVGLIDFEKNLENSIRKNAPDVQVVNLSRGIDLIEGHCTHGDHTHRHNHGHGIDPHIWNSPKSLKIMADNLYATISEKYPDSLHYQLNYTNLKYRLEQLDSTVNTILTGAPHVFMIYHPALTYLARDYGLVQIALENDGKEPSADYIRKMIDTARKYELTQVFYQEQFSHSTVESISKELKIRSVPLDPLAFDVITNTVEIAKKITSP